MSQPSQAREKRPNLKIEVIGFRNAVGPGYLRPGVTAVKVDSISPAVKRNGNGVCPRPRRLSLPRPPRHPAPGTRHLRLSNISLLPCDKDPKR